MTEFAKSRNISRGKRITILLCGVAALCLASAGYAATPKPTPVANGGTGLTTGTSGGIPGFTSTKTMASSAVIGAGLPVLGGGAGAAPTAGTRSGNSTKYVTTTGSLPNGDCVQIDSNGNFVDAGGACTTGGGGGTVTSALINQLAWYSSAGTVVVGLTTADNGILVTSASGVPSISTTAPSGLTIPSATLSSPTMTTPILGTPTSGTLTNATGYTIAHLSGAGTGVLTALAANVTGSGGIALATSPTFVTPALGTIASGNGAALTGLVWSQIGTTPTTLAGYGITNALSTALANTDILVGNGSGLAAPVAVSGDCTLANTGAITCLKTGGVAFGSAANVNTGTSGATVMVNNANNTQSGNGTFSGANAFTGVTTFGTLIVKSRSVTAAGAVTISATTDYFICINKTVGAATTANLPGSPTAGLTYEIKDCKGDAGTNNITVTPASGTIDGASTFVISNNYGAAAVTYNGTEWSIN